MTRIIHGENLEALRRLEAEGVAVDLAYLDPPFLTNETFRMKDGRVAFDDKWPDRATYLEELAKRLIIIHRLLAPHGSLVIHVDPKTSHAIKVFCDAAFGEEAFASEIVWRYRRWPSGSDNFQRVHDVLLRYRKDPKVAPRWNQLYEAQSPHTLRAWGTKKQRMVTREDGSRTKSIVGADESPGVPMGDVWELGVIAPSSKERTGYPTQKPERLLERVVASLSNPGDLVLDPYMGSGTTLAVAMRLSRHAIGIDASDVAVEVASKRLGIASIEKVAA
jgi:DNA modification methylase